jgi:tetratricopeptide (TPR) repeat protein
LKSVISCSNCGVKFSAARSRCPRCRAPLTRPDPSAAAASSRKLARVAGGLLAGFLVLLGALWFARDPEPSVPVAAAADPYAARRSAAAIAQAATQPQREGDNAGRQATPAAESDDLQAALVLYQGAVARNPDDADSFNSLGQVLVRLNRSAEALPHFERAVALEPDNWGYSFNMGRALGALGRWQRAETVYRRAQALLPDDGRTTLALAQALREQGNLDAAVTEFAKAVALQPREPTYQIELGKTLESLSKPVEAAAAYEEAVRLAPEAPDADTLRKRIALLRGSGPE